MNLIVNIHNPVCLVHLVSLVYLSLDPENPNTQNRSDRPNRPNEQGRLGDFFSTLPGCGTREEQRRIRWNE
jgi:hypothetical protein